MPNSYILVGQLLLLVPRSDFTARSSLGQSSQVPPLCIGNINKCKAKTFIKLFKIGLQKIWSVSGQLWISLNSSILHSNPQTISTKVNIYCFSSYTLLKTDLIFCTDFECDLKLWCDTNKVNVKETAKHKKVKDVSYSYLIRHFLFMRTQMCKYCSTCFYSKKKYGVLPFIVYYC